jgi:hypothetical protein
MGKNKDEVKPTQQEIALSQISKQQLARYEAVFAPFEDEWLKESRVSGAEKERLAGQIGGQVEQAFAGEQKKLTGMNPAGGNFTAGMRDLAVGKGKAASRAQTEGGMQMENADVSALMSGVRLGRGQAIEAQAGMEQMAGHATSRAIGSAFADRASKDATADMVGSGMGVLAYGATKIPTGASGGTTGSVDNLSQNYSLTGPATAKSPPKYSLMS